MTPEQAATTLVYVTGALVVATLLLAGVSLLQYLTLRGQADDQRDQVAALSATATSTQAMADEMRAARIASNRLEVIVNRANARPGVFEGRIYTAGGQVAILRLVELFVGQGPNVGNDPVASLPLGNAYITNSDGPAVSLTFASDLSEAAGDLLVVRVTATPVNGDEQTHDTIFRIKGDRTLADIASDVPSIY
jgi:hypothetical protein